MTKFTGHPNTGSNMAKQQASSLKYKYLMVLLCIILAGGIGIAVWQAVKSNNSSPSTSTPPPQPPYSPKPSPNQPPLSPTPPPPPHPPRSSPSRVFVLDSTLVCAAPRDAPTADRRIDKSTFTLVNFNTLFLFLAGSGRATPCPGPDCEWKTLDDAKEHLRKIAEIIAQLNGDWVNLVEVEGCHVLESLINHLPSDSGYVHYLTPGKDIATGQNVGFLSRVDPLEELMTDWRKTTIPMPRSTYEDHLPSEMDLDLTKYENVTIELKGLSKHYIARTKLFGNKPVIIFGIHLMAFPEIAGKCAIRDGQAKTIIDIVQQRFGDESLIITGDFNDVDEDAKGPNDDSPMSYTLSLLKSALNLRNAAEKIPAEQRFSCGYRSGGAVKRTFIDHVLVSQDLWDMIEEVKIENGLYDATARKGERVSDHYPVIVKFRQILS